MTLGRVLEVAKKQQQKAPKRYSRNVTSKQRFVFRVSEGSCTRADRRNDRVSDEMGSEPVLPREAETPVHGVRPLPAWEGETLL